MFSRCFCVWHRSSALPPPTTSDQQVVPPEASTSDYVQAPLHSPNPNASESDTSAPRATATPSLPAPIITSKWEESMPETGEIPISASAIAGRRATPIVMGGPPIPRSPRSAGPPRRRAAYVIPDADKQKMRKAVPNITTRRFTFGELAEATLNFSHERVLGEGGFGCVYKGCLEDGQVVAIKLMNKNGSQRRSSVQFLLEAFTLSFLDHPNLVNLIGYCPDGDHRLLVYEYMPLGSLEDHLHGDRRDGEPLDWNTRMKIAAGAARGLEYLHDKANPPVIYRGLKPSNILLDEEYHPKLSDFGLAKHAPMGDKSHVSTKFRGTTGFWAPEYVVSGQLTTKSDVYSFGLVLLELITGLTVIDNDRPEGQKNLVTWARTLLHDRREFMKLADPRLQGQFPKQGLFGALAIVSMCIQENAIDRPVIGDVVDGLSYLAEQANNL